MASNALYRTPDSVMNALSGPQGPLGMSPNVNRLSLLPRYNQRDGLVAPQWLYDLARAAEAPGNALMGHQTSPEEAFNFAGNIAGAGLGTSAAMKAPAPGPGRTIAQTVYHGSPHDFDKFDLSRIGTGEGNQAYGHGLYAAEARQVAEQYRPAMQGNLDNTFSIDGKTVKLGASEVNSQSALQAVMRGDRAYAEELLSDWKRQKAQWPKSTIYDKDIEVVEQALKAKSVSPASGRLYTVDLPDSAIANMLDWDAPLSQQPEAVRKALEKFRPRWESSISKDPTGQQIYDNLAASMDGFAQKKDASAALRKAGLSGIRYLDGGSRSAGDGTRNFVVFDDKLLKILNKE